MINGKEPNGDIQEEAQGTIKGFEEALKCINNPYYLYTNYILINGKPATTPLNQEEFNKEFREMEKNYNRSKFKRR